VFVVTSSLAVLTVLAFAVSFFALCEIWQRAGTGTPPGAQTAVTLAAKLLDLELVRICIRC
jgi:hypothetical protein